ASLATLQGQLETLVVRGVRSTSADDLKQLAALHHELDRVGAAYLGSRIGDLIAKVRADDAKAAAALCGAQTALRVFERVLTLHPAGEALASGSHDDQPDQSDERANGDGVAPAPVKLEDRAALLPMLAELAATVESLIATGLSTASAATRQKLDVS